MSVLSSAVVVISLLAAPPAPAADTRDAGTISGRVTDATGQPIPGVRIEVVEVNRSTVTRPDGTYRLVNLPSGNYSIAFTMLGYRPAVRRVSVVDEDVTLDVRLVTSAMELAAIQVTASPVATTSLTSPQPVSVLGGEDLRLAQRASLGAMLEAQPGLRNFSTGGGIGKPVIRGLTSNRVLVLADGQRLENQQWGDEHGPNIETADASRIEVIRGPASVLFGSDALGGVVNVIPRPLPDATGRRGFVTGALAATYSTNNREPDGSLMLEGASGGFGFRASASGRTSQDIRTPDGPLLNSALESYGGSATAGYRGGWGSLTATWASRRERLEVHEDPEEEPDFSGFQKVQSDRAKVSLNVPVGASARLAVDGGVERNDRQEYHEAGHDEIELGLLSRTVTGDAHLHHALHRRLGGVVGLQALRSNFEKYGEETLIPDNDVTNFGVYAFEQGEFGRWHLSFGLRFDHRKLTVQPDDALGLDAGSLTWNAVTGNLGALYHLSEQVALVANAGRGFRAPSSFELFSNGVHEGTVRFERGNATLRNETSFNTDLALRVQAEKLSAEFGTFYNRIGDYIYPRPTGDFDPESGLRIFDIVQGNARLYGLEAALEWHLSPVVHFRGTADYTHGQNTALEQPLPFIPPFRFTYGVTLEPALRGVERPYLGLSAETNVRQGRTDEFDFAPAGYTLLSLGSGLALPVGNRSLGLDLSVRNLLDSRYASYMSRYKEYALDMGRNVTLRMRMDW